MDDQLKAKLARASKELEKHYDNYEYCKITIILNENQSIKIIMQEEI